MHSNTSFLYTRFLYTWTKFLAVIFCALCILPLMFVCVSPFFSPLCAADVAEVSYQVHFEGVSDKATSDTLRTVSQLVSLESNPPSTLTALHRRAESDVEHLIKGLHSMAYYNAKVDIRFNAEVSPVVITVLVDTGPVYPLVSFKVVAQAPQSKEPSPFAYDLIMPKDLGVELRAPALPKTIIDAERALLRFMAGKGYPLAVIAKREVVADQATMTVSVTLYVDSGPRVMFGKTQVTGEKKVLEGFIRRKIAWKQGEVYDPLLVEKTQVSLEASGLFASIVIMPQAELDAEGQLPIDISLIESRHRTVSAGVSYNTQQGPGVMGTWEHRNMWGRGEKLSLFAEAWWKQQNVKLQYSKPDFWVAGQDFLWIAEMERETTTGFKESFFSISGLVDRQWNATTKFSYGGSYKELRTGDSDNNGVASLLKAPLQLKWSTANNLLDPTNGRSFNFKMTPTWKVDRPKMAYVINTLSGTLYHPLTADHRFVFAGKILLGSIVGAGRKSIPPPELFYAGSENTLRGYNYWSVSPLNAERKPIGGRSMMIYTFEPRMRLNEKFGLVFFYEAGNVYKQATPRFNEKLLQSAGTGLRYHTPVGPLRVDIAFPLNPRKGIDKSFQFYFSIGQAF